MGEYECPSCDASFDSKRGRGVHHVRAHGERLPNRTCDYCGADFYSDYAKRYCSRDCLLHSDAYAGENNPNWKGGRESAECMICEQEFEYYPSEKPGHYCPDCVENETWQTPPGLSGPDHPDWKGGVITKHCDICGEEVTRRPSAFAESVTLCSRGCQAIWFSELYTGEGHPNWKGGGSEHYGKGWRRAKLETLARDDHTCVICGTTREALGRSPDVHHFVPVRYFVQSSGADKTDAHVPENLITLCVTCHRRADFGTPSKAALKRLLG